MSADPVAEWLDGVSRLAEIRQRLVNATPGPWRWFGNTKMRELHLATTHSGRRFVMQFARWGMGSAQPRFQRDNRMVDVADLVTYEVDYRKDISGIDHPDAELIANAPADLAFLLGEVEATEQARALDAAVVEGQRLRIADLEARNAALEQALDASRKERHDLANRVQGAEGLLWELTEWAGGPVAVHPALLDVVDAARELLARGQKVDPLGAPVSGVVDGGGARVGEPAASAPGDFCEALGVAEDGTPYACDLSPGHEGSHRAPTGHLWRTTEPDKHDIHGAVVEGA